MQQLTVNCNNHTLVRSFQKYMQRSATNSKHHLQIYMQWWWNIHSIIHVWKLCFPLSNNKLIIRTSLYEHYRSLFIRHTVHVTGSDVVVCRHFGSLCVWLLESMEM